MNKFLLFAWLAALIATIGSLYFSAVLDFIPCTLCWYQRIFLYPLSIILGLAFYRNDKEIYRYTLPLSIIGMLIAGYHIALQESPYLQQFEMCKTAVPCTKDDLNLFGFITIPMLSFAVFTFISLCLANLLKSSKNG